VHQIPVKMQQEQCCPSVFYREWGFTTCLQSVNHSINKPLHHSPLQMRLPTGTGTAWLATHRKLNQQRYVWWNISGRTKTKTKLLLQQPEEIIQETYSIKMNVIRHCDKIRSDLKAFCVKIFKKRIF